MQHIPCFSPLSTSYIVSFSECSRVWKLVIIVVLLYSQVSFEPSITLPYLQSTIRCGTFTVVVNNISLVALFCMIFGNFTVGSTWWLSLLVMVPILTVVCVVACLVYARRKQRRPAYTIGMNLTDQLLTG